MPSFRRFVRPASTWLVIGGDEYPWCSAATMKHYDVFLSKKYILPSRTVMTPGNHTNGPGGSANEPNAKAWLAYNRANGTRTRTQGGWIDKSTGIPLTDQYIDIAGIRFIFINSGAVKDGNPGWPTPGHSVFSDDHPRVVWLRSVWAPGTRNVVITHHPRWSYYGSPFDNTDMQNLIDEIVGKNDGTKPHSSLIIQGHSHNMQLMRPSSHRETIPGSSVQWPRSARPRPRRVRRAHRTPRRSHGFILPTSLRADAASYRSTSGATARSSSP